MSFKTEMREFMDKVSSWVMGQQNILTGYQRVIDTQKDLIRDLRTDNRDLMNRLMAKDFANYSEMSPPTVMELDYPMQPSGDSDPGEFLAGEILEDETE